MESTRRSDLNIVNMNIRMRDGEWTCNYFEIAVASRSFSVLDMLLPLIIIMMQDYSQALSRGNVCHVYPVGMKLVLSVTFFSIWGCQFPCGNRENVYFILSSTSEVWIISHCWNNGTCLVSYYPLLSIRRLETNVIEFVIQIHFFFNQ